MHLVQIPFIAGLAATLVLALGCGRVAAEVAHKCDPVSDPGWNLLPSQEITGESDSAPYRDASGNWSVDRTTTILPMCNYFDEIGNYSLRSYSLAPRVTKEKIGICRAVSGSRSVPIAPYAGPCPPM
jgi:hypothetical protein